MTTGHGISEMLWKASMSGTHQPLSPTHYPRMGARALEAWGGNPSCESPPEGKGQPDALHGPGMKADVSQFAIQRADHQGLIPLPCYIQKQK